MHVKSHGNVPVWIWKYCPQIFSPTLSEAVFKEKHGVWDPMPQLTIIYNSVVRYPPPLQRERGGVEKISLIGWAHLYLSANFQNPILCKHKYREVEGKGWELTLCLWIDFSWSMGNPIPELTMTPIKLPWIMAQQAILYRVGYNNYYLFDQIEPSRTEIEAKWNS
jgi:hypothetical protein